MIVFQRQDDPVELLLRQSRFCGEQWWDNKGSFPDNQGKQRHQQQGG